MQRRRTSVPGSSVVLKKHVPWTPTEMGTWSEDQRVMWSALAEDPESYYFLYCAPGESNTIGAFSEAEKELLIKLIHSRPPCGQWGLFSLNFPHRTGLQVSLAKNLDF